jgi:diguanylate cyclase (GGDEF)-like protein
LIEFDNIGLPLVMLVDDNVINLQYLAKICEKKGYDYIMVKEASEVIKLAKEEKPDIILLDVMMPGMSGFDLCKIIKQEDGIKDIPVVFITAKAEIEDIIEGFNSGGVDYVTKPFNSVVLESRMRIQIELKRSRDMLKEHIDRLEDMNNRLEIEKERSEWLATRDFLTGAFNRRYMYDRMKDELNHTVRSSNQMSVLMADIDNFKSINDSYGHDAGDRVLVTFTNLITDSLRMQDVVSRWGGEEFIILLPETGLEGATLAGEKIKGVLSKTRLDVKGQPITMSATFGVSTLVISGNSMTIESYKGGDVVNSSVIETFYSEGASVSDALDDLVSRADEALFHGKATGKNKVVGYSKDREGNRIG